MCVYKLCIFIEAGLEVVFSNRLLYFKKTNDTDVAITRLVQAGVILTTYESLLFELTLKCKNFVLKRFWISKNKNFFLILL